MTIVKEESELEKAISHASEYGDEILIEEYIPGSADVVEGFLSVGEWQTIAIFSKPDPLQGPFFEAD